MKNLKKGTYGYLKQMKTRDLIFVLISLVVALSVFGIGLYKFKTRANIATVIAICSLLPACKRIVNLIMVTPFKAISKADYERFAEYKIDNTRAYFDVLFSSEKYIMKFDHCIMTEKELYALSSMNKEKTAYSESYLNEAFKKRGVSVKVKVYQTPGDYEHLLKVIKNENEPCDDAWRFFESLML
jgi:hypothetical protein